MIARHGNARGGRSVRLQRAPFDIDVTKLRFAFGALENHGKFWLMGGQFNSAVQTGVYIQ